MTATDPAPGTDAGAGTGEPETTGSGRSAVDGGLGRDFGLLWSAAATSAVGDGIHSTALPLLAVSLTSNPALVGLTTSVGALPWLLVGVVSGALVDRRDRLRLMWTVDAARFVLVGGLATAIALGVASIPLLLVVGFLLGAAGTLFGTASQAAIPLLVSREHGRLERANGRLEASNTVGSQFVGPPVGGLLFGAAASIPFVADAVSFGLSGAAVRMISARRAALRRGDAVAAGSPAAGGPVTRSLVADVREGMTWLWRNRLLRDLALLIGVFNLSFNASEAILVLLARQRLGLGAVGYGVLLTAVAVGAVAGSALVGRIVRVLGPGGTLAVGMVALASGRVVLGSTTQVAVATVALAVSGAGGASANIVGVSLRQRLTPDRLLGRVISAYRLIALGTIPIGGLLGGALAGATDVRVPFLLGGAMITAATLAALPVINNRSIAAAEAAVAAGEAPHGTEGGGAATA